MTVRSTKQKGEQEAKRTQELTRDDYKHTVFLALVHAAR